jgi:hypothetical protein
MNRGAAAVSGRTWCTAVAAAALVALSAFGHAAGAQPSKLSVSGSPATMRITTATAGFQPLPVMESSTTYSYDGNQSTTKITAQLSAPMPSGVTLRVTFEAGPDATSIPNVALDALARDVVTNIAKTNGAVTRGITYTLSATTAAGVVPLQSRTVTLTIVTMP